MTAVEESNKVGLESERDTDTSWDSGAGNVKVGQMESFNVGLD